VESGKLAAFHAAYKESTGQDWLAERDAYEFNRDQVVEALAKTLGQSQDSVTKWIDNAEGNFSLTVENFAKWVKEYLDSKGPDHRIVFLVDEIGGFTRGRTHRRSNPDRFAEPKGPAPTSPESTGDRARRHFVHTPSPRK
jgi:hypothetical protein